VTSGEGGTIPTPTRRPPDGVSHSSEARDGPHPTARGRHAAGVARRGADGPSRLTFDDPLPTLPETARNLLLAAKHIVAYQGFHALTLNAVSAASGENKAMIAYYFGNKAGLVAAVLDSVIHDEYVASLDRMKHVDPERRSRQLVDEMGRMASATDEFRVFFEMLPHVLRDDALRPRIAQLYRWYWNVKLQWLEAGEGALDDPELLGLTQLLSAVIDGLAVQVAIDPAIDLANPLGVLAAMLRDSPALPRPESTEPAGVAETRVPASRPPSGRP
jgi:AcrR family transcriptional regulator